MKRGRKAPFLLLISTDAQYISCQLKSRRVPVLGRGFIKQRKAFGNAMVFAPAQLTFIVSAFSLPKICDREANAVTAIFTSVNAVLRNKRAMMLWAGMIVALTAIGFATALIGLADSISVLGHATWHAYRETIDASAWPSNDPALV